MCHRKLLGTGNTTAHPHLTASHAPGIPPDTRPVPPQHPSKSSHAPPPTVCICIVRTITSAVDTSKWRAAVLPPAGSPWAQACWLGAQASEPGAQAKTLCAQGSATAPARRLARHAKCVNPAPKAFRSARRLLLLARKARLAACKRNGFAREVLELGVPSKSLCVPSRMADTRRKTLRARPEMPRASQSAHGYSAAATRSPAAFGCAPPARTHTPLNVSGPSATKHGVPPAASRASALVSGARRKTARWAVSQGEVRRALWAAHEALRAALRPNGAACEVLEHGAPVTTGGAPLWPGGAPLKTGGTPPKSSDEPLRRRLLTWPRGASRPKRPD